MTDRYHCFGGPSTTSARVEEKVHRKEGIKKMSGGQEPELWESQNMSHQIMAALSVRVDMQELRGTGAKKTSFWGDGSSILSSLPYSSLTKEPFWSHHLQIACLHPWCLLPLAYNCTFILLIPYSATWRWKQHVSSNVGTCLPNCLALS